MTGMKELFQKLVDTENNKPDQSRVLTKEENMMIKQQIKKAAELGFSYVLETLGRVMRQIASDGRVGYRTKMKRLALTPSEQGDHGNGTSRTELLKRNNLRR